MPNPFLHSAADMLISSDQAVASIPPPAPDAAADISNSVAQPAGAIAATWDIDGTDCISEILTVPRRLIAEDARRAEDFVDWAALEQALQEPLPLFLREDGYLRRRA